MSTHFKEIIYFFFLDFFYFFVSTKNNTLTCNFLRHSIDINTEYTVTHVLQSKRINILNIYWILFDCNHRVGRVLSFSPVVGIGTPATLFGSGGRGSLAGERGVERVPLPTRGHTLWYSLYLCTLILQYSKSVGQSTDWCHLLFADWWANNSKEFGSRSNNQVCNNPLHRVQRSSVI